MGVAENLSRKHFRVKLTIGIDFSGQKTLKTCIIMTLFFKIQTF